jgi:hypothetical protein
MIITNEQEQAVDNWEYHYCPVTNHISGDMGWNGFIFETYGEDLEFVRAQPPQNIWTWVDTDDGTAIMSGYHLVNRIGYFVTGLPWEESITIQVNSEEE